MRFAGFCFKLVGGSWLRKTLFELFQMIRKWFYLGCLLVLAASCNRASNSINSNDTQTQNGKLQVFTVNYPLAYFAERIGGDHVEVHFPAPVDVDPAFWKPSAEIVCQVSRRGLDPLERCRLREVGQARIVAAVETG